MKNIYGIYVGCAIIFLCSSSFRLQKAGNYQTIRHTEKTAYIILDSADFYLYSKYQPEEITRGKGLIMEEEYFFSRDRNSAILPLTIANIENVFAANTAFRYLLEAEFHSNRDLVSYDSFLREYKIKYLYEKSLNTKSSDLQGLSR